MSAGENLTTTFGSYQGPDGKPRYLVNLRCLDALDLGTLELTEHDGKSY